MSVLAPELTRSTEADTREVNGGGQVLLEGVAWPQYVTITEALMGNPGVRTTYDRGSFELMSTSNLHEWIKKRLGRFLEIIAEELDVAIQPGGNTTFRNEELERGFEPDECYWIATEARMRVPVTSWEPTRDPSPDLIIEIEVSRSALDRMDIFAAYGVSEVWRFDGSELHVHRLNDAGEYEETSVSRSFPAVPIKEIAQFLRPNAETDYLKALRQFRDWVRANRSK